MTKYGLYFSLSAFLVCLAVLPFKFNAASGACAVFACAWTVFEFWYYAKHNNYDPHSIGSED